MIEMRVEQVVIDQYSRTLVLLSDLPRRRFLPILIGAPEALAIQMELEQQAPPRPMTHDLMMKVFQELKVELVRIVVSDFRDDTFYATLTLNAEGSYREVDARPSDAIALALRSRASIFVAEKVADRAAVSFEPQDEEADPRDLERFMKLIEGVNLGGEEAS